MGQAITTSIIAKRDMSPASPTIRYDAKGMIVRQPGRKRKHKAGGLNAKRRRKMAADKLKAAKTKATAKKSAAKDIDLAAILSDAGLNNV